MGLLRHRPPVAGARRRRGPDRDLVRTPEEMKRDSKIAILIYLVSLGIYCGTAAQRLRGRSSDIHFSYQAQMFLQHKLELGHPPPSSNDWAEVEYLHLKDGRTVAGAYLRSMPGRFKKLD